MRSALSHSTLRANSGVDDAVLEDVRAVGESLGARVPELIAQFYEWLSRLPEFERFFSNPTLLAHVKAQQANYWRDFLRAEVDENYVERRRLVGQVHARIELGLLIYLRAMEFVSDWLRREVEADERLRRERPSAAFSIRTLILFDSSIVVETYAARTARILEEQRDRLKHVAGVMRAVTDGDLGQRVDIAGPDDLLGQSVVDMVRSLRNIAREMGMIARGDYSADVAPRSEKDELGTSLQAMTRALREAANRNEQLMWLASRQTELVQTMSGNPSVRELSQRALAHLCPAIGAQVGAQYLLENGALRLTGTYAITEGDGVPGRWKLGEGLVGQAALEKRRIVVNDVPEGSIRIRWGLGEAAPKSLLVLPLLHDDAVRGVVELGSLGEFSPLHLEFLDRASSSLGLAISAADSRARIQQLLEESQAQAEELTAQQEELRQVNETLEEQARQLEMQKDSLLATEAVLRQKATEVERASRYKTEFLANMSHELRTPLNSSLILAKLLSDNREGNLTPDQVKYAQTISAAGNDLLALINDILDLAKIEAGKVDLSIESIEIGAFIGNLRRRFDPLIAEKKLEFQIVVAQGCPATIETDQQRIQQILTNLLSNAVKFTEKGSIRLRVAPEDSQRLSFTVEDTGIGIPAEQHEVVFEAFRQADGTTNRKYGGTGLGLSICRELVSLLGGEIRLRSAVGEGSAFRVLLPLRLRAVTGARPAPDPQSARKQEPQSRPAGASRTVLIVEDDAVQRDAVSRLLVADAIDVVAVATADEALAQLRRATFDCVVLDLMLPGVDGFEFLDRISGVESPLPPVIVYTARSLSAGEEQRLRRFSRSVIVKGARSPERLLEEVTRFLRHVESGQPAAKPRNERDRDAILRNRRILLVEDDVRNVFALTSVLEPRGAIVEIARNGKEALARLDRDGEPVDLVLMDVMMPEMDGLEATREIRKRDRCAKLSIIALTAKAMPDDRQECLAAGANDYIAKPIDVEKLLSLIHVWMPK